MHSDNDATEDKTPPILYEDDNMIVVNKPFGMLVHDDGQEKTIETHVEWFLKRVPSARGVGETTTAQDGTLLERSGVVHRLDRGTSGVLVLAKNSVAHAHLKAQFHDRLVKKEYRAFVYGRMNERWGTIDRAIGRSARDFRLRSAQKGARGLLRPAVTHWERIGVGEYEGESFSYVKLMPETGRTHQLRVHLKAIDRPIVHDELYAKDRLPNSNNLGLSRLALHAHILEITLLNGESERFIAPLPLAFDMAAERIASEG